jgi:NapC/NirT cytochrome c family, N-terminal region/Cytochrome c3
MKSANITIRPKTFILAGIVIVLALAALLFGSLEITSQPFFCKSCHYMKSYYDEWKTSSHRNVNCLDCHSKPGMHGRPLKRDFEVLHEVISMAAGKYPSRPHAEVEDASCLQNGCHEKRLLKGKVHFKGVTFDHTPHLTMDRRGKKLRCTSCHAQMVMGRHIAVTEEVCFLCHFMNRMQSPEAATSAFCLKCHKVPDGNVPIRNSAKPFNHKDYLKGDVQCGFCHASVVRGDGRVPKVMCLRCHDKPEILARKGDLEFIHENHITKRKVECYLCHTEIEHSIDTLESSAAPADNPYSCARYGCAQCHGAAHLASQLLYQGRGARGVDGKPGAMALANVACVACHRIGKQDTLPLASGSHFPKADKTSCIMCHGNDGAGYLTDWEDRISKALSAAGAALSAAQARNNGKPEMAIALEEARFNINFVKNARGVHNLDYSLSILKHCKMELEKASALR